MKQWVHVVFSLASRSLSCSRLLQAAASSHITISMKLHHSVKAHLPPPSISLSLHPTLSSPPLFKPRGGWQQGQRDFLRHWVRCSTNREFWETVTCQVWALLQLGCWKKENESWFGDYFFRLKKCYGEGDMHMETLLHTYKMHLTHLGQKSEYGSA